MSQGQRRHPLEGWPALMALLAITGCAAGDATNRFPVSVAPWSQGRLAGRRITTRHFDILSTLRDREFEAALPAFVEAAYRQYQATLPAPREVDSKLTTYIFGTRGEWARFAQPRYPARFEVYSRIRTGGFTEGATSVSFYRDRASTLATLAHEGWHQYANSRFAAPIPAWLNEGLACYHEGFEIRDVTPRFTPQRNTFRINDLRDALQRGELMPLHDVINTDAGQVLGGPNREMAPTYYAQTWALVTFLRHGPRNPYAAGFERMLRDIANGSFHIRVSAAVLAAPDSDRCSPAAAAFRAYFHATPDDLEEAYHDHLLRLTGFGPSARGGSE